METTTFAAPQGRIRDRLATTAMSFVLGFSLLGLAAGSTFAQTGPPGNNGNVKIHDGGTEPSPEVRNQPHVCTFHLHFFFADAGQAGAWWIRSWSPTGDGATVLTGTYVTDTNGEYRTPAEPGAYTLADGHYKLFWEGRSSSNIKHKVFWVRCAASGASGGAGSTENGSTGSNVEAGNAMAQLKAAVRTEVSAEKAELAAVAGVQASITAQLAASARTLTVLGAESGGAPSGNAGSSPAGAGGGTGGTGGTNGSGSAGAGAAANAAVGGAVAGVTVTPPPTDTTTQTSQGSGTPLLPLVPIVLVAFGVTAVSLTRFAAVRRTMR